MTEHGGEARAVPLVQRGPCQALVELGHRHCLILSLPVALHEAGGPDSITFLLEESEVLRGGMNLRRLQS